VKIEDIVVDDDDDELKKEDSLGATQVNADLGGISTNTLRHLST
jgi:hypothetical protein